MIKSKPNYNIESYQTSDKSREIYCSFRGRTITQTIDDRTFCLCQTIFNCRHCSHEEEKEEDPCPTGERYMENRTGKSGWREICDPNCSCMAPND